MNYYLNTFENITQSVERLLKDEHNSLEIKQSATSLRQAVQPCIQELKQSATRLKKLILVCSDELYHAENVWLRKPKIAEAAKHEIWEHLGEISGRSIRISQLGSQCKDKAVEQVKRCWDIQIEHLKNQWFIDAKGQPKKGIGWNDKTGFIKEMNYEGMKLYEKCSKMIQEKLNFLYQEVANINLESLQYFSNLLNQHKKHKLSNKIDLIASELKTKFSNPLEPYIVRFQTTIIPDLKALVDKGWGEIYWEDVVKFKDKVALKIENLITEIFDDRVKLSTEAIAKAIAFYNDFLEQQERYQQETPEQREAEKAWIEQQRQELARIQGGIEVIFNAG